MGYCMGARIVPSNVEGPLLLVSGLAQDLDGTRIRMACVGCKGDWPFLRKAGGWPHLFTCQPTWYDMVQPNCKYVCRKP